MDARLHWDGIYQTKAPGQVSWFQEHASLSLDLIRRTRIPTTAQIIDVGGGSSPLVDDLLADGFKHVTVLDISGTALQAARQRLGSRSTGVTWLEGDITELVLPGHTFDLWHDRAVFHFLTRADDRRKYVETARRSIKPGGHLVMATFALDGPTECSGLHTMRYDAPGLSRELGDDFKFVESVDETHHTPFGTEQRFIYCRFSRKRAVGPRDTPPESRVRAA